MYVHFYLHVQGHNYVYLLVQVHTCVYRQVQVHLHVYLKIQVNLHVLLQVQGHGQVYASKGLWGPCSWIFQGKVNKLTFGILKAHYLFSYNNV